MDSLADDDDDNMQRNSNNDRMFDTQFSAQPSLPDALKLVGKAQSVLLDCEKRAVEAFKLIGEAQMVLLDSEKRGADAFKLIREAQSVLLDYEQRILHESKCKALRPVAPSREPMQASRNTDFSPKYQLPQGHTFWIVCPYCLVCLPYKQRMLHETQCKAPRPVPPSWGPTQACRNPNFGSKNKSKPTSWFSGSSPQFQQPQGQNPLEAPNDQQTFWAAGCPYCAVSGDVVNKLLLWQNCKRSSFGFETDAPQEKEVAYEVGERSKTNGESGVVESKSFGRTNGKKRKQLEDSSESCDSGSSSESEEDMVVEEDGESSLNPNPLAIIVPKIFNYPDLDFSYFNKDRKEDCFTVGQIWALYDTLDAMPRFYARITKVLSPHFKLQINWLEPAPDDENEIKWVDEGLPASCGKFKNGIISNVDDHLLFSHLVNWEKGSSWNTYKIHPRKGETWALFKNWDIKWHSDPDRMNLRVMVRKYEYEYVEVLSDYAEGNGVYVAYLGKVRGFSCIFCHTEKEGIYSFQVQPDQLLFRFSHRVPSLRMTGQEREDVPKGSFELNTACLSADQPDLEEIDVPHEKVKVLP